MESQKTPDMRLGSYLYKPTALGFALVRIMLGYHVFGRRHLLEACQKKPFVVIANHTSVWDSFMVSGLLQVRIVWVTDVGIHQSAYFKSRLDDCLGECSWVCRYVPGVVKRYVVYMCSAVAAYVIRQCDTVLIDRMATPFSSSPVNRCAVAKARADLTVGKCVGVFPEGGIRHKLPKPSFFIPMQLLRSQKASGILQVHVCHQKRQITIFPLIPKQQVQSCKELILNRLQGEGD